MNNIFLENKLKKAQLLASSFDTANNFQPKNFDEEMHFIFSKTSNNTF